jgi:hypothetical protein
LIKLKIKNLLKISGGNSAVFTNDWDEIGSMVTSVGCGGGSSIGVLCDVLDLEDHKNQEYLDKDPNNLIFMIPHQSSGGFKAYGTNVSHIVYDKYTDIFLTCKRVPRGPKTFNVIGENKSYDIDINSIYIAVLRFEYQIYVSLDALIGSLNSGKRIFLLLPSNTKIENTISYGLVIDFNGNNEYDMTSGDHCQSGTDKLIHEIYICSGDRCN